MWPRSSWLWGSFFKMNNTCNIYPLAFAKKKMKSSFFIFTSGCFGRSKTIFLIYFMSGSAFIIIYLYSCICGMLPRSSWLWGSFIWKTNISVCHSDASEIRQTRLIKWISMNIHIFCPSSLMGFHDVSCTSSGAGFLPSAWLGKICRKHVMALLIEENSFTTFVWGTG